MAQRKKRPAPASRSVFEVESAFSKTKKRSSPVAPRSGARSASAKAASRPAPRKKSPARRADPHEAQRRRVEGSGVRRGKKPVSRRMSRRRAGGLSALFFTGIAICLALIAFQYSRYAEYAVMRDAVERQAFYDGTTVDGVDLSGKTLDEALEYWQDNVEARYRTAQVVVENASTVTAEQLGYSSDYREVLRTAWNAGRSGSLEERYDEISRIGSGRSYTTTRVLCNDDVVREYAAALAKAIDRDAVNASILSFDTSSYEFTYSEGQTGYKLDQEKLISDIKTAISSGGGTVAPSVVTTQPTVTAEALKSNYGMIAYAVTNASSSSKNRLANISLALSAINGTRLAPGETFSYNDTVGQRTAARGYKMAPAFSGGEVIEELGGGICQVSTTLFNAAVKADLAIVERNAHSIPVSYVDKGKDATVSWGVQDLKFRNNTSGDVYICCFLSDDKRVRVGIFGMTRSDGVTITLEPVIEKTTDYETVYQDNYFIASGATNVLKTGRKGYQVTTYKVYWDKNGTELRREVLCKSNYGKQDQLIEVGRG